MPKQSIKFRVICINPPQFACGFSELEFGLQDKGKALLIGSETGSDERRYDFRLSVQKHDDGSANFSGAYAHGPRQARFLYLTLKARQADSWQIVKRIKISLRVITWDMVARALAEDKTLAVAVSGQGAATVPLLDGGWQVQD